jgi:hypothetical protein
LIKQIQAVLTPDLSSYKDPYGSYAGCCYPAAEALYHLWGSKHGFTPHVLHFQGLTHWYLADKNDRVVDPTKEQFGGSIVPYYKGKGCGFLTKEPSKRCQIVLGRLLLSIAISKGTMSISEEGANGETRLAIYLCHPHDSRLLAVMKL